VSVFIFGFVVGFGQFFKSKNHNLRSVSVFTIPDFNHVQSKHDIGENTCIVAMQNSDLRHSHNSVIIVDVIYYYYTVKYLMVLRSG